MSKKSIEFYIEELDEIIKDKTYEDNHLKIAKLLKKINKNDEELFLKYIRVIPIDALGEVALELPEHILRDIVREISATGLAKAVSELKSDDATDLIQDIEEIDKEKADQILASMNKEDQEEIDMLKAYSEDSAGSLMQTEYFDANIDETIQSSVDRLKKLRQENELENIYQIFIIGTFGRLLFAIPLEELITFNFTKTYREICEKNESKYKARYIKDTDTIDKVSNLLEEYDLLAMPVVDEDLILVGRITSDDMYDEEREKSTEQIYKLGGVDEEAEEEESIFKTGRKRGVWLFVNLLTAILASLVIGLFDEVLREYVALAILMPIVASMGGNAGTQTLTVMVRQLALGNIDYDNSKDAVWREFYLSIFNGVVFAILIAFIAYLWFGQIGLGLVIATSMVINLIFAGVFGAIVPLGLKKLNFDPAISSTVFLTTITDIVGFFSFLSLAQIFLIK